MANTSLSSVVSNLMRAQMGSAVSSTVTDDDLDRHVAELILKEAKQKAERYGKEGYRAFLPQCVLFPLPFLFCGITHAHPLTGRRAMRHDRTSGSCPQLYGVQMIITSRY